MLLEQFMFGCWLDLQLPGVEPLIDLIGSCHVWFLSFLFETVQ